MLMMCAFDFLIIFTISYGVMAENEAQFETFIPAGGYVMILIALFIGLAIIGALLFVIIRGRRDKSQITGCPESSTGEPKPSALDFNKSTAFAREALKEGKIDLVQTENETEPKAKGKKETKEEKQTPDDGDLPGKSETEKPSVPPRQTIQRSLSRKSIATPEQTEINRYSVMSNSSVITRQASCSSILVRTSPDDAKRPESTRPESTMVTVQEHPEGPSEEIDLQKRPTPPPPTGNSVTIHPEKTTPPTIKAPLKRTISRNAIAPIGPSSKPMNRQISKSVITPTAPAYKPMNRQISRTMSRSVLRLAEHAPISKPVILEEHAVSKKEETPATSIETSKEKQETPATSTETTTEKQETQATSIETTTEKQETPATSTETKTEKQETPATSTETTTEKKPDKAISEDAGDENKETSDAEKNHEKAENPVQNGTKAGIVDDEKAENPVQNGTKAGGVDDEKAEDGTETEEKDLKRTEEKMIEDVAEILNA